MSIARVPASLTPPTRPSPLHSWAKRALDLAIAIIGLLTLWPLLLMIAVAVRLGLGRPVLFVQERPGAGGRSFHLRKFRTMRNATDRDGKPLADDERLTALGRFLRSSSLDELPELWNVLTGDMSLVGPRPWLMEYLPHYTPEQRRRHDTRPGITGWAQVNGRNAASWEERLCLDVWYVDHWSLWLDLRILLRTVWTVVRREGISAPGHATMPRFDEQRAAVLGATTATDMGQRTGHPTTGGAASELAQSAGNPVELDKSCHRDTV